MATKEEIKELVGKLNETLGNKGEMWDYAAVQNGENDFSFFAVASPDERTWKHFNAQLARNENNPKFNPYNLQKELVERCLIKSSQDPNSTVDALNRTLSRKPKLLDKLTEKIGELANQGIIDDIENFG